MHGILLVLQKRDVRRVLYFTLLGLVWIWISWGLAIVGPADAANMTIKPVLQTKILLVAALFGGRYLFFPTYRWRIFFKWSVFLLFLLMTGAGLAQTGRTPVSYLRLVLSIGDYLIWAIVLGAMLELVVSIFRQQSGWDGINPGTLRSLWVSLSRNLNKMGIFIAVTSGILYYYLVNLFLVDIFCYSYILLIPLLGCGGALYGIGYRQVYRRLGEAIQEIDVQLTEILKIDETGCREVLPWYQFLVLSRNYLEKLKRPAMLCRTVTGYLLCATFLLILPYLLGFAITV